jgi:hypothetical protein
MSRARLAEQVADLPVAAWLTGMVVFSVGFRFLLALWVPAPWLFADELKYSELAKSFAATGHFAIRDVPGSGLGPVYPVLIAPAYALFDNVPHAYVLAKAINCVLMSLAGIPTYFLARRLLTKPWSLAAAALALAVPSMVYTGTIMTENVFYPIFVTAALAIVRVLELPSARRQLLALGVIALAFLTRAQAVALLPALVTAIVWVSAVDAAGERLRFRQLVRRLAHYLPTWIGLVGGLVALSGWESVRGRSPLALFGEAQGLWHLHYSIQAVARWFLYHLAELDLYVGVLPFAAFLILATFAFSRGDRALRIFAVTSLSVVFWLLLTVAVFASSLSRYDSHAVSHVIDRYTFYLAPLLLIPLLAWVSQRLPGSARKAALAALSAGALVLVLPYNDLIRDSSVPDTIAFLPWSRSPEGHVVAMPHVFVALILIIGSLAGLFYRVRPPRLPLLAPSLVLLIFITVFSSAQSWYQSQGAVASTGPDQAWIDHAIGSKAEAVAIWSGRGPTSAFLEDEFFNRSVGRGYYLRQPVWAGLPEYKLVVSPKSGVLVDAAGSPVRARFALVDPWVLLRGRVVARNRVTGMRLYRLNGQIARISAL